MSAASAASAAPAVSSAPRRARRTPSTLRRLATGTAVVLLAAWAPSPAGATAGPAGAEPLAPGGTVVTGELVQAYAEVGGVHAEHPEPPEHPAVEALEDGHRPGLLSWVQTDDGREVRVHTDDMAAFEPGERVSVRLGAHRRGVAGGDPEAAENTGYDVLAAVPAGSTPGSPEVEPPVAAAGLPPHKVTVAMVAPAGSTKDSATLSAVVSMVEGTVSSFWSGQTNGAVSFDVVTQRDWTTTTATCANPIALWDEVATKVGFTAGDGKHLLVYVPTTDSRCYAGLGTIGGGTGSGGRAYVKGLSAALFAHELGHNIGLEHSDGLLCNGVSDGTAWGNGCTVSGYRDWYDVMGVSWDNLGSLTGLHTTRLGLMPQGSVVVPTGPSWVQLQPISARAVASPRAVKLVDGGYTYSIEYRPASGQDAWLSTSGNWRQLQPGLLVRRDQPGAERGTNKSVLLDMTPSSSSTNANDWSSALPVGQTFTTATGAYKVKLTASSPAAASLSVAVDGTWPTPSAPGAPGPVTSTRGDRSATVSWAAPSPNGAAVSGYQVTASPGGATCTTAALTCTVTNLTNGTPYTFTVTATNVHGTGPASAPSAAVTPAGVPAAPTSAAAVAANTSAAVSWQASAANGSPVSGYTVTSSPGARTCASAGTGCTVTGLTNGTAYTFTVKATNAVGTSAASAPTGPVVPVAVPGRPGSVVGTAADSAVSVSWTAAAGNGSAVTGYTVTADPGGGTCTTATTACTVTGLDNGTAYTVTVRATNSVGTGPASLPSAAVTPAGPPGLPTSVVALPGSLTATVSWSAAPGNGRSVTGYVVTASPGGRTCTASGTSTSCTVTQLSSDTSYTFTVRATSSAGTGAESSPSNAVVPLPWLGSRFEPLSPTRLLDTRVGTGAAVGKVGAGGTVALKVTDVAGVPASGVTAVVLNVTATQATASGHVSVYPSGQPVPAASNLNLTPGVTTPNLVVVKVGAGGTVNLFNSSGTTHLIADIAGYYTSGEGGSAFEPLSPTRLLDTRVGTGAAVGKVGAGGTVALKVTDVAGVPASGVTAVVLNVTATQPTASGHVSVYPSGQPVPAASNLNLTPGVTRPNLVVVKVGAGGTVNLFNSSGTTHLIADIAGYYGG